MLLLFTIKSPALVIKMKKKRVFYYTCQLVKGNVCSSSVQQSFPTFPDPLPPSAPSPRGQTKDGIGDCGAIAGQEV